MFIRFSPDKVFDALKDPCSSDPAVSQITRMCFKINIEAFFSSYSTETYDEKTNINFQNLCGEHCFRIMWKDEIILIKNWMDSAEQNFAES